MTCSPEVSSDSSGVWLRLSIHDMAASAASCSGQPIAIFRTPSAATAVSAEMLPEWPASQIGPCTSARTAHGITSSHVRRLHRRTTWRLECHAVGSPVTLPIMKPTRGQPAMQVSPMTTAYPVL